MPRRTHVETFRNGEAITVYEGAWSRNPAMPLTATRNKEFRPPGGGQYPAVEEDASNLQTWQLPSFN
jgi:hypothetical protein